MSCCGQLEEFAANHSHLLIITVIAGMFFIRLYLLLARLFYTAQLLRRRVNNESPVDSISSWCRLFSFLLVVYCCPKRDFSDVFVSLY